MVALSAAAAGIVVNCGVPLSEPLPTPDTYDFDSAATASVMLNIDLGPDGDGNPQPPVIVNAGLPGRSIGSWNDVTGDMTTQLSFTDGTLPVNIPDASVGVGYQLSQAADATGHFDPITGVGHLSADLNLDVVSIDLGGGAGPMAQPCRVGLSLDMAGNVDLGTQVLSVHQDGFGVTPPGADDCGGLGSKIGQLLGGPINSMDLTFSVAPTP